MVESMGGPGGTMGSQQYCLKWNNHQNNMLRVFTRLLGQEQFTDVILAAEGKHIKCHKMVLSACSSYFEQLFVNFSEPNQIVILKDTSFADIAAIVDFMYKGEINVSQDKLSSLLKTAENLKVKGLAEVSGDEKKNSASAVANSVRVPTGSSPGASPAMPRLTGPPPMQMMGRPTTTSAGLTSSDNSFMSLNGDLKRKRGRPRTLDGPEDDNNCFGPRISSVQGGINGATSIQRSQSPSILSQSMSNAGTLSLTFQSSGFEPRAKPIIPGKLVTATPTTQSMSPLQAALNKPLEQNSKENSDSSPPTSKPASPNPDYPSITPNTGSAPIKLEQFDTSSRNCDTPGSLNGSFISSLTPDQVASWGIIKMNDYLVSGTRQQYWEEYFVKHVMSAVKNKEIDMKGAAELLGVSYGTLYGRYRETFGYLKHAWNVSGRPQKKTNLWTDPNTKQILESMRSGSINIKQAAEALGMEPAMLAYQLAGKVSGDSDNNSNKFPRGDENGLDDDYGDDEDNDYNEQLMEVQPDIIMHDDEDIEQFDSIIEEEGVDPISEFQIEHNPTLS